MNTNASWRVKVWEDLKVYAKECFA